MSDPTIKRNNGGEIRGYNTVEPPKTPPIEDTPAAMYVTVGAGDVTRNPLFGVLGSNNPLEMYQEGDKVGGDNLKPLNTFDQEAWKETLRNRTGIIEPTVNQVKKDRELLKVAYGDAFDENIWNQIVALTPQQRLEFIPSDIPETTLGTAATTPFTQNTNIYLATQAQKNTTGQEVGDRYEYDKLIHDSLLERERLRSDMQKLYDRDNFERDLAIKDLTQALEDETITPEEYLELGELQESGPVITDAYKNMYERVAELNDLFNYTPKEGYNPDMLSGGYKFDKEFRNTGAVVKNWIKDELSAPSSNPQTYIVNKWMGDMLGDLLGDTAESLFTIAPNARDVWKAFDTGETETLKQASKELGLDVLDIVGVLTILEGGSMAKQTLKEIAGVAAKSPEAAKALLTKELYKNAAKGIGSSWKKDRFGLTSIPNWAKRTIRWGALGSTAGGLGYSYLKSGKDPIDFASSESVAAMAAERYGGKDVSRDLITRVLNTELDLNASYPTINDFYIKKGISPEEGLALYGPNSGTQISQVSPQAPNTALIKDDSNLDNDTKLDQKMLTLELRAKIKSGTATDKERLAYQLGDYSFLEEDNVQSASESGTVSKKFDLDSGKLGPGSTDSLPNYNAEYDPLLKEAQEVYNKFKISVSDNDFYQYLNAEQRGIKDE